MASITEMSHCSSFSVSSCIKKKTKKLQVVSNQSSALCLPELKDFGGELLHQKKRKRKGKKKTEREVILPFFCFPGWSLHPEPQRGAEYTSPLQWRGPTEAVAICVSVCV
ncbi:hypothetical protein EXN66_Car007242 [Channa argus]|uniref:Uncharacterized protein n=1 Tax=Channa argus TaxID=215402 RepID=A0A6G1PMX3_CHAAH|nr:hypothetical protein EXN66_Car007242 [Channa argus]